MPATQSYQLTNNDLDVTILSYGAAIYKLCSKNKDGVFTNNVLGYHNIDDYLTKNGSYLGVVVGPSCGRIRDAAFRLNDTDYALDANARPHNLHGGNSGFSRKNFRLLHHDSASIILEHTTAHLQNGFPGTVRLEVEYRLDGNQFIMLYRATSSHDTLMDISNHSYFNLNDSHNIPITNHQLRIDADFFGELDSTGMVSDALLAVADTPFDLRKSTSIQSVVQNQHQQLRFAGGGLDHPFLLNVHSSQASLSCPASGKTMHLATTAPALVCYSATQLPSHLVLDAGITSQQYAGICLETQHLPNAINSPYPVQKPILLANHPFTSRTTLTFGLL